ncbi:MAG: class I SAM-dependent methyltransferase [Ktedonobacteraceae bacterium]
MDQQSGNDTLRSETSGYIMNPENTAEMARLTKLGEHLSGEIGLLPTAIDLTTRAEILDIGCGPGGWVMEIARRFPLSRVRGIDISALMIAYAQFCAQTEGRTNVQFMRADARQRLPFPDATFDIVHARFAGAWLSKTTWPSIIRDYFRILKPGGIVCCTEFENMGIMTSAAMTNYSALCMQALRLANQCFSPSGDHSGVTVMLPSFFQDTGLQHIQLEAHAVLYSFGASGYHGMVDSLTSGLKLIQPFLLSQGVATQAELDVLYGQAMEDMRSADFRAIVYYLSVWGEK